MLSILIIAPDSYPPDGGESIVTYKFIKSLLKEDDLDFRVVARIDSFKSYPYKNEDKDINLMKKILLIEGYGGKCYLFKKISTLLWIIRAFKASSRIIKNEKVDIIFSRVMPVYGHLPALMLKFWYNIPWIANWSDPAPLCISPKPYKNRPTLNQKIQKLLCKMTIRRANYNTFPSLYLAKYMVNHYKELYGKFKVIPHIALSDYYTENRKTTLRFNISHTGGLGLRRPDLLLEALSNLKKQNSEFDFIVNFVGPRDERVENLVDQLNIRDNIVFAGLKSYKESIEIIQNCDVALVVEADLETGIFLPSKLMDIIQAGKPILAISPVKGVISDLLQDNKGGFAIQSNDLKGMEQALNILYKTWQDGALVQRFSSSIYRYAYKEDQIIKQFIQVCKSF